MAFVSQQVRHLLHAFQRVYLLGMGGKGGYAHPFLASLLAAHEGADRGHALVAQVHPNRFRQVNVEAQGAEHLGIAFHHGFQGWVGLSVANQFLFLPSALVDDRHSGAGHGEAGAQILGAEHIVQVGHSVEVAVLQSVVEPGQPDDAIVLGEIDPSHQHVGWQPLEQRHKTGARQHGDAQLGVLRGKGIQHRDGHGSVTHGTEPHDKQPLDDLVVWRTEHGGKGSENRAKNKINRGLFVFGISF